MFANPFADFNLMRAKQLWLTCLAAVLVPTSIHAQSHTKQPHKPWQADQLQVDDGLPSATVYSMAQDDTGYMWFGTTGGLARYDGHSFLVFKHDGVNPQSISNNNAGNIFIDSQNQLWIGTFGGGANRMNLSTGSVHRYPYSNNQIDQLISENVQTFYEDHQGSIWIGTAMGLYQLQGDVLKHYDQHNGLAHSRVWSIVGDSKNTLWIGTSEGLSELNIRTGKITNHVLPESMTLDISSNQFRTMYLDDGLLWIGSSSGLYSFNLSTRSFDHHSPNHKIIKINDIEPMGEDHLLIASMEGVLEYHIGTNHYEKTPDGELWQMFSHLDIRQIMFDRADLLWLATRDNGVLKVDQTGGLFRHHVPALAAQHQIEKNKPVWSMGIAPGPDHQLLLGTSETVLMNQDGTVAPINTNDYVPGIVRDMKVTDTGTWFAGSEGLFFLARDGDVATPMNQAFELTGVKPSDVFSIEVTTSGEVWMALYNVGLLRWNPDTDEAELIQSHAGGSLSDSNLSHVFVDSRQDIWIGSNLVGLFRYRSQDQQIELFSHDFNDNNSLSSNRINDVYEDTRGELWVATARGLDRLDRTNNQFIRIAAANQIANESIQTILEDSQQNLWLGTQFGLARYDSLKNVLKYHALNDAIKHDGFFRRSATIDPNGVIYLGSVNGYYSFDPSQTKSTALTPPNLVVTNITIDNRPLSLSEVLAAPTAMTLNHDDHVVSFEFSTLDYLAPNQINYHYRLLGMHDDWLDVTRNRHIELNQLKPGQYEMQIKASNTDGRWDEVLHQIDLQVNPVWWNRGWVRFVFVIMGLALAWLLHHNRTIKIRKQNQLLEEEVANRTAELSQLNKQLKSAAHSDFLTGLANRMAFIKDYRLKEKNTKKSTIVLADIDHFKNINDEFGHTVGDEVLKRVGQTMLELIREDDLLARWGGEEFIFYFDHMNAEQTHNLIERIRQAVESTPIQFENHIIPVTLTFGICQRQAGMSLNDCINAADEAMYQGKNQGRNQVVVVKA